MTLTFSKLSGHPIYLHECLITSTTSSELEKNFIIYTPGHPLNPKQIFHIYIKHKVNKYMLSKL